MCHLIMRRITEALILFGCALPADPAQVRLGDGGYRVILWCGDTVAQVGAEGSAEIEVPFERPAILGFAEALQPQ